MTALDQLAELCGIQNTRPDTSGIDIEVGPELKRALLTAMQFKVGTDEQTRASLDELASREWKRVLPPVMVAYVDEGNISIPVVIPADAEALTWTLTLEDGAELSDQKRCAELPLLDEHELDGRSLHRRLLKLQFAIPPGYHSLKLQSNEQAMTLIVTPGRCWLPADSEHARFWGVASELFTLRSSHNWGIGDFGDLRQLVSLAGDRGADIVGLNPVHAMFLDKPQDASPYSPSDRILLNVLNIDVEAIPEFANCEAALKLLFSNDFQRRLSQLRNSAHVQYEIAAELKLAVLRLLFTQFEEQKDATRTQQFREFHEERRELLDRACLFQGMRAYFSAQEPSHADCHEWPEEYRNSRSPAVHQFAQRNAQLVRFHLWMQWIADTQLKAAAEQADQMVIGLYRDLAVGAHASGAEVWSQPDMLVAGASIGAPPDALGPAGQNWGLPPLHPIAAREHAYRSFIDLLRANMRYAGALRVDHVMSLMRLYWIPKHADSNDGAYVHYPLNDLIGILALESHRHRCLVIGEDLGTVPNGFRERMAQANILSYRVLFFEKEEQAFQRPQRYPHLSLSVAANHDLPTIRGWWHGSDIDVKERLGLYPGGAMAARQERERDRLSLLKMLERENLITQLRPIDAEDFVLAAHAFIARTESLLAVVQIDDITGEEEQVNLPGTTDENPNWRRRVSATLEELANNPHFDKIARVMNRERTRALNDEAA